MYKWIFGVGAFLITRKIGLGIIGFIIGSLVDQLGAKNAKNGANKATNGQDPFEFYRRQSSLYDVPTMLMALSSCDESRRKSAESGIGLR